MSLKSKGEIKDYGGNIWHVIHRNPYYIDGIRIHGLYRVYFKKKIDDLLWKECILGEWEYQDVIAGKGRIQVRVEG